MGKKYRNLIDRIVDEENLYLAYEKAAKNKGGLSAKMRFDEDKEYLLHNIRKQLIRGTYTLGKARRFVVYEPKRREITALPFKDRVVQHAICNIIDPIFENLFHHQSYACRTNKGTHKAGKRVQAMLRQGKGAYCLKTDFRKYFPSISRKLLMREFGRKISCQRTLKLISIFLGGEGNGIPIGNLMSQLGANVMGHVFDRWLVNNGVTNFVRYMDDVVILGSRTQLEALWKKVEHFVKTEMGLDFSKWSIRNVKEGVNFCGYRIWNRYKLLRKSSVTTAKKKIKRFKERNDNLGLRRFIGSWSGHICHADVINLVIRLKQRYNLFHIHFHKAEKFDMCEMRAKRQARRELKAILEAKGIPFHPANNYDAYLANIHVGK